MKHVHGFSLIEVLAAMVIFSTGAVVLFDWINQTAGRLGRLSQEQHQLFGDLIGLEYARSLNPTLRPSGEVVIDDVKVRWQTEPVGQELPVRSGSVDGSYLVRLYRVRLTTQAPKSPAKTLDLYLDGWRERAQAGALSPTGQPVPTAPPGPNANAPR